MPSNTYKLISSVTVGAGGAASIDFTSIPATYTDLKVVLSSRSNTTAASNGDLINISLNGSTSTFTRLSLYGTGSGAFSYTAAQRIVGYNGSSNTTANTFGNGEIYIPNYAGSAYKSISADSVNEDNATAVNMGLYAALWSTTSAITSLSLSYFSGNFVQYSTAYLYGIKNS